MLPAPYRRGTSPHPRSKSPAPRKMNFDEPASKSKTWIIILIVVAIVISLGTFFIFIKNDSTADSQTGLGEQLKFVQTEANFDNVDSHHDEHEHHTPSASPQDIEFHNSEGSSHKDGTEILTRLKVRLDSGEFDHAEYFKMQEKVRKMYPDEDIPDHLLVQSPVAPTPNHHIGGDHHSKNPSPHAAPSPSHMTMHIDRRGKFYNVATQRCISPVRPAKVIDCEDAPNLFYSGRLGRLQVLGSSDCVEARTKTVHEAEVWTYPCHTDGGNQKWEYNPMNNLLKHLHGLCLASRYVGDEILVSVLPCNSHDMSQKWQFRPKSDFH